MAYIKVYARSKLKDQEKRERYLKYSEAEKLNFQEANKLLDIEDTLEFAVQVYEDVRSNRQALLKDIMR